MFGVLLELLYSLSDEFEGLLEGELLSRLKLMYWSLLSLEWRQYCGVFSEKNLMPIATPDKGIIKLLISTPAHFSGKYEHDDMRVLVAYENLGVSSAKKGERIYQQYIEVTVAVPPLQGDEVLIPDFACVGEDLCVALSVLFGKVFYTHGVVQQHGLPFVPDLNAGHTIRNRNLCFNSSNKRVDYQLDLDLKNIGHIENVLKQEFECGEKAKALSAFNSAGRFYLQGLRIVEENPELAFLSLITSAEILSSYFKYKDEDIIDEDSNRLLNELKGMGTAGELLHKKVRGKLRGISARFSKCLIDSLDEGFFERSETSDQSKKLSIDNIEKRLKEAYNLRSKYVHTGKSHSGWVSVTTLNDNEEVFFGDSVIDIHGPVIENKSIKKSIKCSPTFVGMERIVRYSLLKFLEKTKVVDEICPADSSF